MLSGPQVFQSALWQCLSTVGIRAVEPDFKKSNKKPDAKVGYRRLYPTLHSKAAADVLDG